jgi:hypothetical protein
LQQQQQQQRPLQVRHAANAAQQRSWQQTHNEADTNSACLFSLLHLQEKLGHVAATVGKIGGTVAATCFVALLIKWCVINRGFPLSKINDNGPVQVRGAAPWLQGFRCALFIGSCPASLRSTGMLMLSHSLPHLVLYSICNHGL